MALHGNIFVWACLKAAAEEACQGTGEAEHWKELPGLTLCGLMLSRCSRARPLWMKLQDLLQLWDRLRQDLEEARAAVWGMANAYSYEDSTHTHKHTAWCNVLIYHGHPHRHSQTPSIHILPSAWHQFWTLSNLRTCVDTGLWHSARTRDITIQISGLFVWTRVCAIRTIRTRSRQRLKQKLAVLKRRPYWQLCGHRFHIKNHAVGRLQPKQQQRHLQCPGFWSSCCSWLASSCPESLGLWAWACQINPWSGSEGNSSPADEPCVYVCACSSCKFRLPWSEQDVFGTSTGPETCLGRSL